MFEKFNYKTTIRNDVDTDSMTFVPLKQLVGQTLHVDGFFFTEGRYGRQVVVIADGYKINFPKRATDTFTEIANNADMLNAVLNGHLSITDIKMIETRNGVTVTYKLTDC